MRNLTFYGKIKVIKSVVLLSVIHILRNTPTEMEYLHILNALFFFKFPWGNKSEKIKS